MAFDAGVARTDPDTSALERHQPRLLRTMFDSYCSVITAGVVEWVKARLVETAVAACVCSNVGGTALAGRPFCLFV